MRQLFLVTLLCLLCSSCTSRFKPGFIVVSSEGGDVPLEIYQIKQESPLQLTSEIIIYSNRKTAFEPGTYLILADCSHEQIVIRPGETAQLRLSAINFLPPTPPRDGDFFSVQCSRHNTGMFRQTIDQRFKLNILGAPKNALISMTSTPLAQPQPGKVSTILLSAIRVVAKNEKDGVYFVSSSNEKQAVTKGVKFGSWQFLMPGAYDISVNGTTEPLTLGPNESKTLETGYLEVRSPADVDVDRIAKTRGYPYQIQLGNDHFLSLNEKYPVLAGTLELHLDSSTQSVKVDIAVNETKTIKLRSVEVDWGCAPEDVKCLGSGEIMLYKNDEHFPFVESITDIPVLFYGDNIKVGISGSRNIRYNLSSSESPFILKTGQVILKPLIQQKNQYITDLIRFEAAGLPGQGFSLDILPSWRPFTMTFIAGKYNFIQSSTKYGSDGERSVKTTSYMIHAGSKIEIEFPYLVSDGQYEKLLKTKPKASKI